MKKAKIKKVIKTFWDCGIDSHNHRNEVVANNCIQANLKIVKKGTHSAANSRNIAIARDVLNGGTFRSVGFKYGLEHPSAIRAFRKVLRASIDITNDGLSLNDTADLNHIRLNKFKWLSRVDEVALEWGITTNEMV